MHFFEGNSRAGATNAAASEAGDEEVKPMLTREVVSVLARNYPEVKQTQGINVKIGRLLKAMNYEQKDLMQGSAYFIVPVSQHAT